MDKKLLQQIWECFKDAYGLDIGDSVDLIQREKDLLEFVMGLVHLRKGNLPAAHKRFSVVLQIEPDEEMVRWARNNIGYICKLRDDPRQHSFPPVGHSDEISIYPVDLEKMALPPPASDISE